MRELAAYLFLVALFIASVATPFAINLGKRFGVLDFPGPRKIHQDPIPIVGGWAIFLTLTLVVWGHLLGALAIRGSDLELFLGDRIQPFVSRTPRLIMRMSPVYLGALAIFVLGLIDDLKGISVRSRLVVQTSIAIGLVSIGFHPDLGFLPRFVGYLVGVLWIVGFTNSFNFLDGLDGLSAGVALVGTLALLTIMGIANQPDVVFFLSALAGTLLGFLRYNYHPARIFLGSSGSLLVGYLMAMGTLQVTYQRGLADNWLMPLLTPVFVLAIPLYDTASVIMIRLIHKRSISIGDQSHFHHRLMKIGFSHRQTVAFIILVSFSVALSAVRLVQATLFECVLILVQILSILSILVIAERVAIKIRAELLKRSSKNAAMELEIPEVSPLKRP